MKKQLSPLLALVMIFSMFAACGKNNEVPPTQDVENVDIDQEDTGNELDGEDEAALPQFTYENQLIGLSSVDNAREIGGYPAADGKVVRSGVILRTGSLEKLSDEDIAKLKEEYNLAYILDLRSDEEREKSPEPVIEGVEQRHLNVWPDETQKIGGMASMLDLPEDEIVQYEWEPLNIWQRLDFNTRYSLMYGEDFTSSRDAVDSYREMFRILLEAEDGESILYHCTHGKDRTGIATVLILSALGTDWDTILEDYLMSNVFNADSINASIEMAKAETDDERLIFAAGIAQGVSEVALDFYKTAIDSKYGGMENYLREIMLLSDDDIQTLRNKYTVNP